MLTVRQPPFSRHESHLGFITERRKPSVNEKGKHQVGNTYKTITNVTEGGGWTRSSNDYLVMR